MATFSLSEIIDRCKLRKSGSRWVGPCPKPDCGGSATSDKFNLWADGGFRCYGCGWKGDVINWLRDVEGMSCPEAHEAAGRQCRKPDCKVYGTCRMGDGTERRQPGTYRPKALQPRQSRDDKKVGVSVPKFPSELWLTWAESLLEKARKTLQNHPAELAWLAARGIPAEIVARAGFGWLDHDIRIDRASIGLSPEKDGKTRIWIPGGLLIPIFDRRGQLHRLRVRRTPEARAKFLDNLKYVWIEGSGTGPLVIRPTEGMLPRGVVVQEAELDAWACAAAHEQVIVIGLGSVAMTLPQSIHDELHTAPSLLVGFDADPGKDGNIGAGPKEFVKWSATFRQAKFWPVPSGKDAGDYAREGGNLRVWLEAGLVPLPKKSVLPQKTSAVQPQTVAEGNHPGPSASAPHDLLLSPECAQRGEGGKDIYAENEDIEIDDYLLQIKELPEAVRDNAREAYAMMQAHPIMPWMSADGYSGGIIATGDWRQRCPEISKKFESLFYGPAYPYLCEIFRERFLHTAKLHGKGGVYVEPVPENVDLSAIAAAVEELEVALSRTI